jgi:hypothetical protein
VEPVHPGALSGSVALAAIRRPSPRPLTGSTGPVDDGAGLIAPRPVVPALLVMSPAPNAFTGAGERFRALRPTMLDERQERLQLRLVRCLAVGSVVLQRLVLPGGLPLMIPVVVLALLWGLRRGIVVADRARTSILLIAGVLCSATAFFNLINHQLTSVNSYFFLLMTYAPFAFVARQPRQAVGAGALEAYANAATGVGIAASLQLLTQLAGITYIDLLAKIVPSSLLAQNFNTTYPIKYGSPILKANAWVCLEPSFLSQVVALGALCVLATGRRQWRLIPLLLGLIATVSGTGIILLISGILAFTLRRGVRAMAPALAALLLGAVVAALSPVGSSLFSRVNESKSSDSSAGLRFNQPFTIFGPVITASPESFLFGEGPGASDRYLVLATTQAVVAPVPIKATYDYGAIAALALAGTVVWSISAGGPSGPVALGALIAWLFLEGALLEPATVVPLWLLCSFVSGSGVVSPVKRPRARTGGAHRRTAAPRLGAAGTLVRT